MKQITWSDALVQEYVGHYNAVKLKFDYDAQAILNDFKKKVAARTEPVKEDVFEAIAGITRPQQPVFNNAHVAEPFRGILDGVFNLQPPQKTPLDVYTTQMDDELISDRIS